MRTLATLLALALLAGCGRDDGGGTADPAGDEPALEHLIPDLQVSNYEHEENLVIRNVADLGLVWEAAFGTVPPRVDFGSRMVLAAFLGPCAGGGHAVSIALVDEVDGKLVVTLAVRRPKSRIPPERTSPLSIVSVPRSDLPVTWVVVDGARAFSGNPRTEESDPR